MRLSSRQGWTLIMQQDHAGVPLTVSPGFVTRMPSCLLNGLRVTQEEAWEITEARYCASRARGPWEHQVILDGIELTKAEAEEIARSHDPLAVLLPGPRLVLRRLAWAEMTA